MEGIIDFLNTNEGAFSVVFSLVVALATVFYAILTRRLVMETIHMRRAQTEPHVSVRVEPSEFGLHFIELVIQNVGSGTAYEVRFSTRKDFEMERIGKLSELGLFQHGIHYLAPGQTIKLFLTSVREKVEEIKKPGGPFDFDVNASYKSASGVSYEYRYPLDLRHLLGITQLGQAPLLTIAQEVKHLRADVRKLTTGFSRMKVDAYTTADRENEKQEVRKWLAEERAERESAERQEAQRAVDTEAPEE